MKKKIKTSKTELRVLLAALLLLTPAHLGAQTTVTEAADPGHDAGALHRALFGNGYRHSWIVPITVPVLDIGTFAGGLKPFREGGNQSRTLRFQAGNGKVYQFRSTRKFLPRAMPDDLQDTPAGDLIHDQSSAMHPTGHMVATALQEAAGILHSTPQLIYLPDDPRLGEYRKTFGGMMGQLEERPQDYDDNARLNFAGAEKVHDPDKVLETLDESMEAYVDEREYLRARLMDILIGDTDRGADQWEFARFDSGDRKVYRPIPRDRDYAFMHTEGLLIRVAKSFYKKLVTFDETYDPLLSYLFMTREFDRTHLGQLTWADWETVISDLQRRLTDQVIDNALMRMPPEQRQLDGPNITRALKVRRDGLRDYAREYYHWVSEEAVVFGSDENERAEVERNSDGSVTVRLFRADDDRRAAWQRRFVPEETSEIRVFLDRGNDQARVFGSSDNSIDVRIVGGEGNDNLTDESRVSRGGTYTTFYDAHGDNTIVTGPHTRVSTKGFETTQPARLDGDTVESKLGERVIAEERRGRFQDQMNVGGFIESKTKSQLIRDWGQVKSIIPAFELHEGTGLVIGGGYQSLDFGFRRAPYETRWNIVGLVSPTTGRLGAQFTWDRHRENSNWSYSLLARGTQFEANRFYGYGNDTPELDVGTTLVRRDEVVVHPSLNYSLGTNSFITFGPIYKSNKAHVEEGGRADVLEPFGTTESISQFGAQLETVINTSGLTGLPRKGFVLKAGASSYAGMQDIPRPFHEAHAMAATYLSFGSPVLALRAGGKHIWGDLVPLHEAAFIGGSGTVRGYRWNRFVGDASAFGGAELRIPVTRAVLFTRGNLGIHFLGDAGRVWVRNDVDDELLSDGDWHTGYGGGLWFETLSQLFTLSYAKGDSEGRFYLQFGKPF